MTKVEQIEKILHLYGEEKLTKEEATSIILSINNTNDKVIEIPIIEEEKSEKKSDVIEDIAHELMYAVDETTGGNYFDYEKVIEYYQEKNWVWYGYEKMTEEVIFNQIKDFVKDCTDKIVKEGKLEYSVSSGGIKVCAYVDDDDDIQYELEFIPETGYCSETIKRYKEALDD